MPAQKQRTFTAAMLANQDKFIADFRAAQKHHPSLAVQEYVASFGFCKSTTEQVTAILQDRIDGFNTLEGKIDHGKPHIH